MYSNDHPFYFPYATSQFTDWAPKYMSHFLNRQPSVVKEDIVYRNLYLNGSKVLVVGGGPSSLGVNTDGYTDLWTMNKFYMSSFSGIKFDLIGVGAGVNLYQPEFINYCNKYDPQLAFEIHPNWQYKRVGEYGMYHTKMYGQIGMGVRMVNLAASLGAKEVSFIGFDGPGAILEGRHAFEPGKTELPSLCTRENADEIHLQQYRFFWQYIKGLYPETKFISIDKENRYHS